MDRESAARNFAIVLAILVFAISAYSTQNILSLAALIPFAIPFKRLHLVSPVLYMFFPLANQTLMILPLLSLSLIIFIENFGVSQEIVFFGIPVISFFLVYYMSPGFASLADLGIAFPFIVLSAVMLLTAGVIEVLLLKPDVANR